MALISDLLLLTAAIAAAVYCRILSKRLKRLSDTDTGLGGAITTLSMQTDELKQMLASLSAESLRQTGTLQAKTIHAEKAARRLELLLASLHDAPPEPAEARVAPVLKLSAQDRLPKLSADKRQVLRNSSRKKTVADILKQDW